MEVQVEAQASEITIFLLSIYDKSEEENISDKELRGLIDDVIRELDEE